MAPSVLPRPRHVGRSTGSLPLGPLALVAALGGEPSLGLALTAAVFAALLWSGATAAIQDGAVPFVAACSPVGSWKAHTGRGLGEVLFSD